MFTTREERSFLFVPDIIWIGGRRIADRARTEKLITNDWLCYRRKIERARTVTNREQPGAAPVTFVGRRRKSLGDIPQP